MKQTCAQGAGQAESLEGARLLFLNASSPMIGWYVHLIDQNMGFYYKKTEGEGKGKALFMIEKKEQDKKPIPPLRRDADIEGTSTPERAIGRVPYKGGYAAICISFYHFVDTGSPPPR